MSDYSTIAESNNFIVLMVGAVVMVMGKLSMSMGKPIR